MVVRRVARGPRLRRAVCCLALVGALIGLGSPAALAQTGIDPCQLLTVAQRQQLGVNPGVPQPSVPGVPAVACTWTSLAAARFGGEYLASVFSGSAPGGTAAPAINGLPTVEFQPPGLNPSAYCVYLVTVAANQTLWAQYGSPRQAGITHLVACRNAQAAAARMASTFGTLAH